MQALAERLRGRATCAAVFTHGGRTIPVWVTLNGFRFRLPDRSWEGWAVVARTYPQENPPQDFWLPPPLLVLITQRPVRSLRHAWSVHRDWAQRGRVGGGSATRPYRFLQEDGLDVEAILLRCLEPFRRMLLIALMAASFLFQLPSFWSAGVIRWIRRLASAVVGTAMDRQGPYLFQRGLQRLLAAVALLEAARIRPPPLRYLPVAR